MAEDCALAVGDGDDLVGCWVLVDPGGHDGDVEGAEPAEFYAAVVV